TWRCSRRRQNKAPRTSWQSAPLFSAYCAILLPIRLCYWQWTTSNGPTDPRYESSPSPYIGWTVNRSRFSRRYAVPLHLMPMQLCDEPCRTVDFSNGGSEPFRWTPLMTCCFKDSIGHCAGPSSTRSTKCQAAIL